MKFGDLVIYNEFGSDFPALVVSSRDLEHHGGAFDEPLLNLVFVKPVKDGSGNELNVSGTAREVDQVQFRHDIAHDSHQFSDAQKQELEKKGLLPPGGSVAGGRWREGVFGVSPTEAVKAGLIAEKAKAKAQAEAEEKAKEEAAAKVDPAAEEEKAIEREAKIRLKQEELKAEKPKPSEPEKTEPEKSSDDPGTVQ